MSLRPRYDPIGFILGSGDVGAKAKLDMILGFQHGKAIEKGVATLKRLQRTDRDGAFFSRIEATQD